MDKDYEHSPKNETKGLKDLHLNAPMETETGELNKAHLSKAVKMVEQHSARGEHAPMVAGYQHDPKCV